MPTDSTGNTPANQERPATPIAEDDAGVINIPNDQVHPALASSPHPDQTRTYPVVVNGKQENWTLEKLTAEAQTGAAGREKFQEAAAMRKETASDAALREDLKMAFEEGDVDAFRRFGAAMGVDGREIEKIADKAFKDTEDEDVVDSYFKESDQAGKDQSRSRTSPGPVDYSQLAPDLQRLMKAGEGERIKNIVDSALDSNEVIAYNMKARDPAGRAAVRQLVDERIQRRLTDHGGDFGDGTRILAEVIPEVQETLEALGIPSSQRTKMGLGLSPGGSSSAGVHQAKLPDHVSSSEGESWEQHILETMDFHHGKSEEGSL